MFPIFFSFLLPKSNSRYLKSKKIMFPSLETFIKLHSTNVDGSDSFNPVWSST